MSQNKQRQKIKLEPRMESVIRIKQPMGRLSFVQFVHTVYDSRQF